MTATETRYVAADVDRLRAGVAALRTALGEAHANLYFLFETWTEEALAVVERLRVRVRGYAGGVG